MNRNMLAVAVLVLIALLFLNWPWISYQVEQLTPADYEMQAEGIAPPSTALPGDAQWVSLFDGESLSGWMPKFVGRAAGVNLHNTFRAGGGVLSVDYSDWDDFNGEFGHLVSEHSFDKYILRFEYRFVGEQVIGARDNALYSWARRNNGAMLHSQSADSMALEQSFPVSLEAQLLGGLGSEEGERSTGNLCTPGTHAVINGNLIRNHCINSVSPTYHGDQWVQAEFEVLGSKRLRHFINGELVFEYTEPQLDGMDGDAMALGEAGEHLTAGHIALQAESAPTQFKNIMLIELP